MDKPAATTLCAQYHYAVELVGRRWAGAIVNILLNRPHRFAEIAAAIPDISDRMLAERLRELEEEGVLQRTVVPETPVRVEYALTAKGLALEPAIRALGEWATEWVPAEGAAPSSKPTAKAAPAKKARAGSRR
jgi:DNA-binding HxlR family transcriptional regulator